MNNILEVVRDSLEAKNVSPKVLEKVPVYVKRAIIKLQHDSVLPPRILEFKASEKKEERRDKNNNLMYNFFFLPTDFLRLDKLVIHKENQTDNVGKDVYQHVSNDSFFNMRRDSDERNFFTIKDYNLDEEKSRKILIADPYPKDNDTIELVYQIDGTKESLDKLDSRYWEPVIATVENMLDLKSYQETKDVVLEETQNRKNQEGQNNYNQTFKKTKVRFLFGK